MDKENVERDVKVAKKSAKSASGEKRAKKALKNELTPLMEAAKRISEMLCELSADRSLFVSEPGDKPERRLDAKALKEFSGVIKEMSAVMTELRSAEVPKENGDIHA